MAKKKTPEKAQVSPAIVKEGNKKSKTTKVKPIKNDSPQTPPENVTTVEDKTTWSKGEVIIAECESITRKGELMKTQDGKYFRTGHTTGIGIQPGMCIRFECVQEAKLQTETEDGAIELMKIDQLEPTDEGYFLSE